MEKILKVHHYQNETKLIIYLLVSSGTDVALNVCVFSTKSSLENPISDLKMIDFSTLSLEMLSSYLSRDHCGLHVDQETLYLFVENHLRMYKINKGKLALLWDFSIEEQQEGPSEELSMEISMKVNIESISVYGGLTYLSTDSNIIFVIQNSQIQGKMEHSEVVINSDTFDTGIKIHSHYPLIYTYKPFQTSAIKGIQAHCMGCYALCSLNSDQASLMNFSLKLTHEEIGSLLSTGVPLPDIIPLKDMFGKERQFLEQLTTGEYTIQMRKDILRALKFNCGYKKTATYMKLVTLMLKSLEPLLTQKFEQIPIISQFVIEDKELKDFYKKVILEAELEDQELKYFIFFYEILMGTLRRSRHEYPDKIAYHTFITQALECIFGRKIRDFISFPKEEVSLSLTSSTTCKNPDCCCTIEGFRYALANCTDKAGLLEVLATGVSACTGAPFMTHEIDFS